MIRLPVNEPARIALLGACLYIEEAALLSWWAVCRVRCCPAPSRA